MKAATAPITVKLEDDLRSWRPLGGRSAEIAGLVGLQQIAAVFNGFADSNVSSIYIEKGAVTKKNG